MGAWTNAHTDTVQDSVHNSLHYGARVHAVSGATSVDTPVDSVRAFVHQAEDQPVGSEGWPKRRSVPLNSRLMLSR